MQWAYTYIVANNALRGYLLGLVTGAAVVAGFASLTPVGFCLCP